MEQFTYCIYHHIVGFNACHDTFEAFTLLTHCQMVVHATHKVLHTVYHFVHGFDLLNVIHMLLDGCQQQIVLGQPLHGTHNDVGEAQAVAHLLRLAPGQVSSKQ